MKVRPSTRDIVRKASAEHAMTYDQAIQEAFTAWARQERRERMRQQSLALRDDVGDRAARMNLLAELDAASEG